MTDLHLQTTDNRQCTAAAAAAAESLQSCPTLCDPIDGSPPGSPVPGILKARILEWVAARINRHVNVLLQLHVAKEQTKSGFAVEEVLLTANEGAFNNLSNVTIAGVMAMATFTDDMEQVASEFETVHNTFLTLRDKHFADNTDFKEISMGMSDDWHVAVQHGATLVRIGTDIFGAREY